MYACPKVERKCETPQKFDGSYCKDVEGVRREFEKANCMQGKETVVGTCLDEH